MKQKRLMFFAVSGLISVILSALLASAGDDPLVPESPRLLISLIQQTPDPAQPGDILELSVKFENNGTNLIRGVQAEIVPEYPFSLLPGEENVKYIGSLGGINSIDFRDVKKFRVKIDGAAPSGMHFIDLKYTTDVYGGIKRDLPVSVRTKEAVISIPEIILEPENIAPGKSSLVKIVLENDARSALRDIRFSLELPAKFSTLGSGSSQLVSRLEPGENASAEFRIAVDSDAVPAVYKIPFKLQYEDEAEKSFSKNGTIGIPVNALPEYSLNLESTGVYTKNSNGRVVLGLSNTGPANMKFTLLELLDTNEYEVISSPKTYLGNLEPDDFETAEFTIHTTGKPKETATLRARLTYKDDFNTEFSDEKAVAMKIYSGREAQNLGLVAKEGNFILSFIGSFGIPLIVIAALAYLIIDLKKRKLPRYQRLLWLLVIISIIGAPLYYYFVMRKHPLK